MITYILEALLGAWVRVDLPGMARATDREHALRIARAARAVAPEVRFRLAIVTHDAHRTYPDVPNMHQWTETGRTYIDLD